MFQGSWSRYHDTHQHHDDRKDDRALRVIRQGVQDLGTGKDVKADEENVIGHQHEARKCISNSTLTKCIVSKIAYSSSQSISICGYSSGPGSRRQGVIGRGTWAYKYL